jgi:hypothetical protein
MFKLLGLALVCVAILSSAQTGSSKYQPGTITAVARHQNAPGETGEDVARYDVSVKVGNTLYKVLYAPPNGANYVEYTPGFDLLVLVGKDTLTFNSRLSGVTAVPIVQQEALPAQNGIDWSKVPGHYFSMKLDHLSETLGLSEDQQASIKPALEQETGEVGQIYSTSVLSRKEKLNRWEKIVRSSDEKIKPFLSQVQVDKLQELRKGQKQEMKRLLAEQKVTQQN